MVVILLLLVLLMCKLGSIFTGFVYVSFVFLYVLYAALSVCPLFISLGFFIAFCRLLIVSAVLMLTRRRLIGLEC